MALLDKFRTNTNSDSRSDIESILDNLSEVLNTRRGYGSFLKDFGILDLSDQASREQIALAVVKEVQRCIEAYEPRVVVHEFKEVPQLHPTRIAFSLVCSIADQDRPLNMVFDTQVSSFDLGMD